MVRGLPLDESPESSSFFRALAGLLGAVEAKCREMDQKKRSLPKKLTRDRRFRWFTLLYMYETDYPHLKQ